MPRMVTESVPTAVCIRCDRGVNPGYDPVLRSKTSRNSERALAVRGDGAGEAGIFDAVVGEGDRDGAGHVDGRAGVSSGDRKGNGVGLPVQHQVAGGRFVHGDPGGGDAAQADR